MRTGKIKNNKETRSRTRICMENRPREGGGKRWARAAARFDHVTAILCGKPADQTRDADSDALNRLR